jgi:peptide deformylase
MAILPVRLYGDPVLRRRAEPAGEITPEIGRLLGDMVETMGAEAGIGLAATQVGIELRLLVVDEGRGVASAYLDPVIVDRGGEVTGEEGCLSLPGMFADVTRAEWVVVEARDGRGAPVRRRASGLLSRVFQHEIDHLDGILFIDRLDRVTRERIKRRIRREGFREQARAGAHAL